MTRFTAVCIVWLFAMAGAYAAPTSTSTPTPTPTPTLTPTPTPVPVPVSTLSSAISPTTWAQTLERIATGVVTIQIDSARAFDTEWNTTAQATGFVIDRSEEHTSELQSLRHLVC